MSIIEMYYDKFIEYLNRILSLFGNSTSDSLANLVKIFLLFIALIFSSFLVRLFFNRLSENKSNKGSKIIYISLAKGGSILALRILFLYFSLEILGFSLNSLFALFGATFLALGIALKQDFEDISSGVRLIVLMREVTIGDEIEFGEFSGKLTKISLTHSVLESGKNVLIVPNSKLVRSVVVKKN